MTLSELKAQSRSGAVDTVMVALADPFGRLVGKRCRADVFIDSIAHHGTHGCADSRPDDRRSPGSERLAALVM